MFQHCFVVAVGVVVFQLAIHGNVCPGFLSAESNGRA